MSNQNEAVLDLDDIIKKIEKKYGAGIIQHGCGTFVKVESIPTGIGSVDVALGCGGIPKGRVVEAFGPESSGKTTFCLQVVASCQSMGGMVAFVDAEHALDPEWAGKIGVDMSKLLVTQPDSGDDALAIVDTLVRSGKISLIVVDSVAALVPKEELDSELGDIQVGAQARLMSKFMRRISGACRKTKTAVIFINQLRDKVGKFTGFGKPEITPGGRALKFYSSVRIEIKSIGQIAVSNESIGIQSRAKIVKSKVSPPFRSGLFNIYFGKPNQKPKPIFGIDQVHALVEGILEAKAIDLKGSNYYIDGNRIANGKEQLVNKITEDSNLFALLFARLQNVLKRVVSTGKDDITPVDAAVATESDADTDVTQDVDSEEKVEEGLTDEDGFDESD